MEVGKQTLAGKPTALPHLDYIDFVFHATSIISSLIFQTPLRALAAFFKYMSRMSRLMGPEALETVIESTTTHAAPSKSIDGLELSSQKQYSSMNGAV